MPAPLPPPSPRLFLVDGYALIYRAFFALLSRPLRTARGENTSAVWGVANFLQRLLATHRPEHLGWVHDAGLSFRHERYPAYKATREKLGEELQADFDRGMARIESLLEAMNIPILSCEGYEADDVIGTLATEAIKRGVSVTVSPVGGAWAAGWSVKFGGTTIREWQPEPEVTYRGAGGA